MGLILHDTLRLLAAGALVSLLAGGAIRAVVVLLRPRQVTERRGSRLSTPVYPAQLLGVGALHLGAAGAVAILAGQAHSVARGSVAALWPVWLGVPLVLAMIGTVRAWIGHAVGVAVVALVAGGLAALSAPMTGASQTKQLFLAVGPRRGPRRGGPAGSDRDERPGRPLACRVVVAPAGRLRVRGRPLA